MNVQVVVQTDDGQERSEIFQPKGPISIGRHPNCVLRLESDLVSRQHAVVEVRPQSIVVEDVSTNGTLAGDRLLRRESVEIPFGTPIVVGNFTIYLLALDAQQQPMQQPMRPVPRAAPPPMASYGPPPMAPPTGMIPHAASTGALPVTTGIPAVGMSGASVYALRRRPDAESFAAAWDIALDQARDRAFEIAMDRAINGITVPRFYRGRFVGTTHRYDYRLAMAVLKPHVLPPVRAPGKVDE